MIIDNTIEKFHSLKPYSLEKEQKRELLLERMNELTEFHKEHCEPYSRFLTVSSQGIRPAEPIEDIPFIPIRLFKELDLKSVSDEEIFKTMMSSGTSGQRQSKIYLDKSTAILQQKVLFNNIGTTRYKERKNNHDRILIGRKSTGIDCSRQRW